MRKGFAYFLTMKSRTQGYSQANVYVSGKTSPLFTVKFLVSFASALACLFLLVHENDIKGFINAKPFGMYKLSEYVGCYKFHF